MSDDPIVHDNRRFIAVVILMFACGVAVAVVAGLAMATARHADQRSIRVAQQQLEESQVNLVAAQVAACDSRNQSRSDTRAVWGALLDILAADRGGDSPQAAQFRAFIDEAYDPISCVWGAPGFNTDTDPASLPADSGGF